MTKILFNCDVNHARRGSVVGYRGEVKSKGRLKKVTINKLDRLNLEINLFSRAQKMQTMSLWFGYVTGASIIVFCSYSSPI